MGDPIDDALNRALQRRTLTVPNPETSSGDVYDQAINRALERRKQRNFRMEVEELLDKAEGAPPLDTRDYAKQEAERAKARGLKEDAKQIRKDRSALLPAMRAPKVAERAAKLTGDPELINRAAEIKQDQAERSIQDEKGRFERFMEIVDLPGRATRALVKEGTNFDPKAVWNNEQGQSEDFQNWLRAEHPNVRAGLEAVSAPLIGAPIGLMTAGAGAVSDLFQGKLPDPENLKQAFKEGIDTGTTIGTDTLLDPTTYVPFLNTTKAAKFASQGTKAAKLSGIDRQAAKGVGAAFKEAAPNVLGKINQADLVSQLAKSKGLTDDALRKVMGEGSKYAGEDLLGKIAMNIPVPNGTLKETPQVAAAQTKVRMLRAQGRANEAKKLATLAEEGAFKFDPKHPVKSWQATKAAVKEISAAERAHLKGQWDEWLKENLGSNPEFVEAIYPELPPKELPKRPGFMEAIYPEPPPRALPKDPQLGFFGDEPTRFANYGPKRPPKVKGQIAEEPTRFGNYGPAKPPKISAERVLDPQTKQALDRHFEVGVQSLSGGYLAPLMNIFKQTQLLSKPAYHVANLISDAGIMVTRGMTNVLDPVRALKTLYKGTPDGTRIVKGYTAGDIRQILRESGISENAMSPLGRLDYGVKPGPLGLMIDSARSKIKNPALRAAASIKPADVLSGGLNRMLSPAVRFWDEASKTTMLINRLDKGDSVENALRYTFQTLPDYTDPGRFPKLLEALRTIDPLIGWTYRMAGTIPPTVARNPAALSFPMHVSEAFDQQRDPIFRDDLPMDRREQGNTLPIGQSRAIPNYIETITGERPDPGIGYAGRLREGVGEWTAQALNPADMIMGGINPLGKYAVEQMTEQPLGKYPKQDFNEFLGSFVGALPKRLWNEYARRKGGLPSIGFAPKDATKSGLDVLNDITGLGLYQTVPGEKAQDLRYDQDTKEAARVKGDLKKAKKKKRMQ